MAVHIEKLRFNFWQTKKKIENEMIELRLSHSDRYCSSINYRVIEISACIRNRAA